MNTHSIAQRFWPKVQKSEGCWIWTGAKLPTGYGSIAVGGRQHGAHRVAYEMAKGEIPAGMCVLHSCDNPSCVRPDHLRVGTHKDNSDDRVARDRNARGARHGSKTKPEAFHRGARCSWAKLTEDEVREIRDAYARGGRQVDIAADYGVSQTVVSDIVCRKIWRSVP